MDIRKKIKGGALQFVLFIGAVIAILLLAFISLTYSHHYFQKRGDYVLAAVEQANNGINYVLHNEISVQDSTVLHLKIEGLVPGNNTLTAYKKYWGLFEMLAVHSVSNHKEFTKIALTGGRYEKEDRYSLLLRENNMPLVVVEDAQLQGRLLLPKQGLRPGNMGGESFTGILSPPSAISQSNTKFPAISKPIIENLKLWLQGSFDNNLNQAPLDYPLNLKNSFSQKTKLLYSNTSLSLTKGEIVGNVLVYSGSGIFIGKQMRIKDAIVIAPKIEIEQGFKGSLQAIASGEIIINDKVTMEYPSALVLYRSDINEPPGSILIRNQSLFQGAVVYLDQGNEEKEQFFNAQVKIEKGAIIDGEVYCSKGIELLGEVRGSVTSSYFITNKFGSVYQNHIYGGKINVNQLHENYTGLLFEDSNKKVMKWLY